MTDKEFLRALGGPTVVSAMFGIKAGTVSMWQQRGIASAYHILLWRLAKERGWPWRPPGSEGLDLIILPGV